MSSPSAERAVTEIGDRGRVPRFGEIGTNRSQKMTSRSSHVLLQSVPSVPTQNTSIRSGRREKAATRLPAFAGAVPETRMLPVADVPPPTDATPPRVEPAK